jgi:hypothetical protein
LLDCQVESGQLDNTMIVLVSDNGASGKGGPNGSAYNASITAGSVRPLTFIAMWPPSLACSAIGAVRRRRRAELTGLGPQPLAHGVELVDLGATVGVDHRPLTGLVGLPPVVDEGAVAVVAGLEGTDAVMLGIGGDRLLQVAGADVIDGPLLPGLHLPPVHRQLAGARR